jgi:hypothetical protein
MGIYEEDIMHEQVENRNANYVQNQSNGTHHQNIKIGREVGELQVTSSTFISNLCLSARCSYALGSGQIREGKASLLSACEWLRCEEWKSGGGPMVGSGAISCGVVVPK